MATQGIVSIVAQGVVRLKIVAGADGYNAPQMAAWLQKHPGVGARAAYDQALKIGFGGVDDLVVQFSPEDYIAGEFCSGLSDLYRERFSDPTFNPRWDHGTSDYVEIVKE